MNHMEEEFHGVGSMEPRRYRTRRGSPAMDHQVHLKFRWFCLLLLGQQPKATRMNSRLLFLGLLLECYCKTPEVEVEEEEFFVVALAHHVEAAVYLDQMVEIVVDE